MRGFKGSRDSHCLQTVVVTVDHVPSAIHVAVGVEAVYPTLQFASQDSPGTASEHSTGQGMPGLLLVMAWSGGLGHTAVQHTGTTAH
jgi:hypothetical protein